MKIRKKHNKPRVMQVAASGLLLVGLAVNSHAGAIADLTGYDANETSLFKNNGIVVGGWANAGITYNASNPANGFNGPVTFSDRDSEVQLNQLNLFVQRAVATEGDSWDFGARADVMFGSDAIFTQAYGTPAYDVNTGAANGSRGNWDLNLLGSGRDNRFYDLALPQMYLEAYVPVGNGLNVKVGRFYTAIGYETVPAPDNFFYSHAYTMQYGEPFTHTGIMTNYTVNQNWTIMNCAITGGGTGGWDGSFNNGVGNWAWKPGVTWTSDDKGTSFTANGTVGATSERNNATWAMYSLVAKHNITEKTHLVLQHDHGFADNVAVGGNSVNAEWYGVNMHLTYDVRDDLTAGIRTEWFRDQNGFRVWSPGRIAAATDNTGYSYAGSTGSASAPTSYYAVTAGLNWKPMGKKWLNIRPNVRYDWADGSRPFGNQKQDQFLFSTDFSVTF